MTEKKTFRRLREETMTPQPSVDQLFAKLGLAMPEEQQPVRNRQKHWIPAVALGCTAAVAIGVCIPTYRNLQENNGIMSSAQVSSAPAKETRKLVWGYDGETQNEMIYTVSPALQKELDKPENKEALFRVRIECYGNTNQFGAVLDGYEYQGETYQTIWQTRNELQTSILNKYGIVINNDKSVVDHFYIENDYYDYLYRLEENQEFRVERQKLYDYIEKEKACKRQFYLDQNASLSEIGIILEPVIDNFYIADSSNNFYATLTKEQINVMLQSRSSYRYHLALPPRPEGYDRRIVDTLALVLERGSRETYQVIVYSTLCRSMGNGVSGYNSDLIRLLREKEITQEFGDNFLAAIRKRHNIEDCYLPQYYIDSEGERCLQKDWKAGKVKYDNGKWYSYFDGGCFKAKLTKEQILELAQDDDVRAICLSSDDPDYMTPDFVYSE